MVSFNVDNFSKNINQFSPLPSSSSLNGLYLICMARFARFETWFFHHYSLARSTTCESVSSLRVGGQSTEISLHVIYVLSFYRWNKLFGLTLVKSVSGHANYYFTILLALLGVAFFGKYVNSV